MSLSILYSRASHDIKALPVTVEVHLAYGIPKFTLVGLPETVVKESKDRVRSAIVTTGFEFPARRITVNLAPASLPKEGGRFDLPIALGILAASKQIPDGELATYEFAGELALSGELRPIQGSLPFALGMAGTGRTLILPALNADEASLSGDVTVFPANHLLDVTAHLQKRKLLAQHVLNIEKQPSPYLDLRDVRSQAQAKRVLEIAASGSHSLLLLGPPGTGKTLLASRLPSILPEMSKQEACESGAILSVGQRGLDVSCWKKRPFRAPHHSASSVALVGGGNPPRPGEISLAHNGVLFLDELPEFNRHVLEALREPLESKTIVISRAARQAQFPANFHFIAAMNPCPCGFFGDPVGNCHCTSDQIDRYLQKLSGPFLDRIDMTITVPRVPLHQLMNDDTSGNEDSKTVGRRVMQVRDIQSKRQRKVNAALGTQELKHFCQTTKKDKQYLEEVLQRLNLSARAYHRILKISRTLADMQHAEAITREHLTEAIQYRRGICREKLAY